MATAQERTTRLEDLLAINNLIGTHSYMHEYDRARVYEELWSHQPGTALAYLNYGVFDGPESIKQFLTADNPAPRTREPGQVDQHLVLNEVIEIARDGKSAQVTWLSIGYTTPPAGPDGALQAQFSHCKYGCDLVKEKGEWKFFRMHVYTSWDAPYEKSWPELSAERNGLNAGGLPPGQPNPFHPTRPPLEDTAYSINKVDVPLPRLPAPYNTLSEVESYVAKA